MSFYRATIIFNDNQQLQVDIPDNDMDKFSDNISNYKIFWNKEQSQGFWTDIKNIRYILFNKEEQIEDDRERETGKTPEGKISGKTQRPSKRKADDSSG